jgi:hypothetical protein
MTVLQSDMYYQNDNFFLRANIFIRLPSNSDMKWDRYVTPFSYGLWLAVVITVCVLGVCLAVTNYSYKRKLNLSVSAILFSIHPCCCRQGECYSSYFLPSFFPYTLNPVSQFRLNISLWLNLVS